MIWGQILGAVAHLLNAGLDLPQSRAPDARLVQEASTPGRPDTPNTAPPLPVASYELFARLDEQTHIVKGRGTLTFTNRSASGLKELYFHLYLNAFADPETLFLRKKGGRSGSRAGRPGRTTVRSLTSSRFENTDLWKGAAKHSPGDPKDRTDIQVPLPEEIAPGETVEFDFQFESQLPQLVERTGFEKDFHLIAQWFPKLAKLEPDGTWAHFAFHPYGEFYADFGTYDVELDVPSAYVVGSTGELKREALDNGRALYRVHAERIHDFAWTAWPGFEEENRTIDGVQVRLLAPRYTPLSRQKSWETLESAIPMLGKAFEPYPHTSLTVVQTPRWATRAGGMEYPTFITTGGNEFVTLTGLKTQELLTVHELGHQWFQGMLASNEHAHPFLDEGITSFAEWNYLDARYGTGGLVEWPWLSVSRLALGRYSGLLFRKRERLSQAVDEFRSFHSLGSMVYARTPLCLATLGRVYGEARLKRAMNRYAKSFRFRHPRPTDLYDALEAELGGSARENAEKMFEMADFIDLSLKSVTTQGSLGALRSRLTIARSGSLELPVEVLVRFKDGTSRVLATKSVKAEWTLELNHSAPIEEARIDPERRIILDSNFFNNRSRGPHPKERIRTQVVAISLATWAAFLLGH